MSVFVVATMTTIEVTYLATVGSGMGGGSGRGHLGTTLDNED
jgi:hypothetical protein